MVYESHYYRLQGQQILCVQLSVELSASTNAAQQCYFCEKNYIDNPL